MECVPGCIYAQCGTKFNSNNITILQTFCLPKVVTLNEMDIICSSIINSNYSNVSDFCYTPNYMYGLTTFQLIIVLIILIFIVLSIITVAYYNVMVN